MALKDRLRDKPVVGTAIAVHERYVGDLGNQLAASMAFFLFLSIFPLLLVALAITGFVLADDPAARQQVVDAVTGFVPGFGAAMGDTVDGIVESRRATGIVGVLLLLFSGLKVVDSGQVATSAVYRREANVSPVKKRLRSLGYLGALGALALIGVVASGAGGLAAGAAEALGLTSGVATALTWTGPVLSFAFDVVFFAAAYQLLSVGDGPPIRWLLPGAFLAAFGWTALKVVGATYVASQAEKWDELLGALGGTIAVMLLFFIAGRIYLYGAELNAVRMERMRTSALDDQEPRGSVEDVAPRP